MKRLVVLLASCLTLFTMWFMTTPQPAQAQTGSKVLELIGQFGGKVTAVAIQDNFAYAGVGTSIVIFDITDPAHPTQVGQSAPFPNFVEDVYVSGTMVYVADGAGGLYIIDASNPTAPNVVNNYAYKLSNGYSWNALGVRVVNDHAYIASTNCLTILNVSNPRTPSSVGGYCNINDVYDIDVVGNYAYLASYYGLYIIDISNPTSPSLVGSYINYYLSDVFVVDKTAYVTDNEGLKLIDVSNPAKPSFVGEYRTGAATSVYVMNGYAYLTTNLSGNQGTLWVIDVSSNPAKPSLASNYVTGGTTSGVYVVNSIAYVAAGEKGLQTINMSDPTQPLLAGSYLGVAFTNKVQVVDNRLYVIDSDNSIKIINLSNPNKPSIMGSYTTTNGIYGFYVISDTVYLATSPNPNNGQGGGLSIVNVKNPNAPSLIGSYSRSQWFYAYNVDIVGNYAYMSTNYGMYIINISNPTSPSLAGSYSGSSSGRIQVVNGYAYVGGSIINVSDPTKPSLVGSYTPSGNNFYVKGNYIYVADGSNGLKIINVSNPAAPRLTSVYYTGRNAVDIQVVGNLAYVSNGYYYNDNSGYLVVLDISNPGAPTFVSSYYTPGNAAGVYVVNDIAHVSDGNGGLAVLQLKNPIPLDSITISGLAKNSIYSYSNFTATISPASATKPIKYTWSPTPYNGQGTAKPTYYWSNFGMQTITVTVSNMNSVVTGTYTVTIKNIVPTVLLTVDKTGNGTITSYPAGIDCGNDCSEDYDLNTLVTLTAMPESGFSFTGWGGVCWGTDSCQVSMYQAQYVTANFVPITSIEAVIISGPTASTIGNYDYFFASVSPYTATMPITYTWSPVPIGGQGTSWAIYTWPSDGVQVITVTASNISGTVMGSYSLNISPSITMTIEPTFTTQSDLPYPTVGDTITYTYILTNLSSYPYVISAMVDDRLGTIIAPVPQITILPLHTITLTGLYKVTIADVNALQPLTNTVFFLGTFIDPNLTVFSATVEVSQTITNSVIITDSLPTLTLHKTADKQTVQPGDTVNYTIVISASGLTQPINLTDTLPFGLDIVSSSLPNGLTYQATTRQLRYNGMVNGNLTLTYQAQVATSGLALGSILYNGVEASSGDVWAGDGVTVVIPNLDNHQTLFIQVILADNNLATQGLEQLNATEEALCNLPNVTAFVWLDGPGDNDSRLYLLQCDTDPSFPSYNNLTANNRYVKGQNLWDLDEVSTANYAFERLLTAITQAYPNAHNISELYVMITGHGNAPMPSVLLAQPSSRGTTPTPDGFGYDEHPSLRTMDVATLGQVVANFEAKTGKKIGLLYLNSCLMSNMEVFAQIGNHVNYVIASAGIKFDTFDNMTNLLAVLASQPSTAEVVQRWVNLESEILMIDGYPHTLSAWNMTQVNTLVSAVNIFAETARSRVQNYEGHQQMRQARLNTVCVDNNLDGKIAETDWVCDLASFMAQVEMQFSSDNALVTAARAVRQAITAMTVKEIHHSGIPYGYNTQTWNYTDPFGGMTIFLPLATDTWQRPLYNSNHFAFAAQTQWDEFINAYWQNNLAPDYTCPASGCNKLPAGNIPLAKIDMTVALGANNTVIINWNTQPNRVYTLWRWVKGQTPQIYQTNLMSSSFSEPLPTDSQEYCYQLYADGLGYSTIGCVKTGQPVLVIADSFGKTGSKIVLNIDLRNIQNFCLGAAGLAIQYPSHLLKPIRVLRGNLTQNYAFTMTTRLTDSIRIGTYKSDCQPLNGSGTLAKIEFEVIGYTGQTGSLLFTTGSGNTTLYSSGDPRHPIGLTIQNGKFTVGTACIMGDANCDGVIDLGDALMAVQTGARVITPTIDEKIGCDTNGDGKCNAGDAILISCYFLNRDWSNCGVSIQNRLMRQVSQEPVKVCVNVARGVPNQSTFIPVRISQNSGVAGGDLVLTYDSEAMAVESVRSTALLGGVIAINTHEAGIIRLSFADNVALPSEGTLLDLKIMFKQPKANLAISEIALYDVNGQDFTTNLQRSIITDTCIYKTDLPLITR